jgi:hypothetical protein
MSERVFRLIFGTTLWIVLLLCAVYQRVEFMYGFIALLLFEGVTNLRIPILISRWRYGKNYKSDVAPNTKSSFLGLFEAERALRFIIAGLLIFSYFIFNDYFLFFSWFIAGMLIVAGISSICPMVMFLRWVGFK